MRSSCGVSPTRDRRGRRASSRGDVIVSAGNVRVHGLADFYRKLWDGRGPGDLVTFTVERKDESRDIAVRTGDRYRWLRLRNR